MSDREETIPQAAFGAIKASGFPFQTLIRHVVTTHSRWQVTHSEYPWKNENGKDEFLDLVAANRRSAAFHLLIECKKTNKEKFIFLRPLGWDRGECHVPVLDIGRSVYRILPLVRSHWN